MQTKEEVKAYYKIYYQTPKGRASCKASAEAYNQSPKGKASRKVYSQSLKGKAHLKAARKAYNRTSKGRFKAYKRSAWLRKFDWLLTYEEFMTFWQKPCDYCRDKIETIGLDRVDNTKGYSIDNIKSCCKWCNRMKMNYSEEEFIEKCGKIYRYNLTNKK